LNGGIGIFIGLIVKNGGEKLPRWSDFILRRKAFIRGDNDAIVLCCDYASITF